MALYEKRKGTPLADFTPRGNKNPVTTLEIIDVVEGTGAVVPADATITAHYTGAAKQAALLPITVVVPLRRRADSLERLFRELEVHRYEHLEIIVVIYQTAGSRAQLQARQLARRHGLTVKTVRHRKGLSLERIAHSRARGEAVILLAAHDRLTHRFFEHASYALTQKVTALRVRQFVQLDARLITTLRALVTLCREAITHAWHRPRHTQGLRRGVIVRRDALVRPYKEAAMLFDNFAVERPHESVHPSVKSLVALGALLVAIGTLVATTPFDVLAYVSMLALGVIAIVVALLVIQHSGYRPLHKLALLSLLPFAPLYYLLWLIRAAARVLYRTVIATSRRPRSKRQVRQPQPARTQ